MTITRGERGNNEMILHKSIVSLYLQQLQWRELRGFPNRILIKHDIMLHIEFVIGMYQILNNSR